MGFCYSKIYLHDWFLIKRAISYLLRFLEALTLSKLRNHMMVSTYTSNGSESMPETGQRSENAE